MVAAYVRDPGTTMVPLIREGRLFFVVSAGPHDYEFPAADLVEDAHTVLGSGDSSAPTEVASLASILRQIADALEEVVDEHAHGLLFG